MAPRRRHFDKSLAPARCCSCYFTVSIQLLVARLDNALCIVFPPRNEMNASVPGLGCNVNTVSRETLRFDGSGLCCHTQPPRQCGQAAHLRRRRRDRMPEQEGLPFRERDMHQRRGERYCTAVGVQRWETSPVTLSLLFYNFTSTFFQVAILACQENDRSWRGGRFRERVAL